MPTTTDWYAASVPIVSAAAASSPPTPKPALRIAWRNPNHSSRSPGSVIWVTIGPSADQNAVRVSDATNTSTVTAGTEWANG